MAGRNLAKDFDACPDGTGSDAADAAAGDAAALAVATASGDDVGHLVDQLERDSQLGGLVDDRLEGAELRIGQQLWRFRFGLAENGSRFLARSKVLAVR